MNTFSILFYSLSLFIIFCWVKASNNYKWITYTVGIWTAFQLILGINGFYEITTEIPPRVIFLIGPPMLFIATILSIKKTRNVLLNFDLKWLTFMHTCRIPVEIGLLGLFTQGLLPKYMTFEGSNFDIITGLTAPLVLYFGIIKKKWSPQVLIIWNILGLALLFNVVGYGILSAPTPFQQFSFDQPNIAILRPYVNLLPSLIVPSVFLSHVISIMQLIKIKNDSR